MRPADESADGKPRKSRASAEPAGPGELTEWFAWQYARAVGLGAAEGGARFRQLAKDFPAPSDDSSLPQPLSGLIRMSAFLQLRLQHPLGPAGYSSLVMSAGAGPKGRTHYAYAYWRRGRERDPPEYVCVSPTFDSRDGEYRGRFVRYPAWAAAYEAAATALAPLEAGALGLCAKGQLQLEARAYPADAAEALTAWADRTRLPVTAFAVALALDLSRAAAGTLAPHTSGPYVALLQEVAAARPELARQAIPAATHGVFVSGSSEMFATQCGQKLVPLFVREVMQVGDYALGAWRELLVARLAGDLVLNFVAPGFALYNQWSYVEDADAALFENAAMRQRYARGGAAALAMASVREARRQLDEPSEAAPPSFHGSELSARLYEELEYAQSFLLVSPVALLHTMEHAGMTLRSLGDQVRRPAVQWPAVAGAFATRDAAARTLFGYAYGAHCLHSKLGVAHTDLHAGNLTLHRWGFAERARPDAERGIAFEPLYAGAEPVVAYVAGPRGEADTYLFPAVGLSECIIDYSRCILGPAFRPRLEAAGTPQAAANVYRDQVNRVVRVFHAYAPGFVEKNQAALKAAVLADFDAAFPVLCAVDFIAVGRNVGAALADMAGAPPNAADKRPFVVDDSAFALASRLETAAQEAFITGLHDLVEARGPGRRRAAGQGAGGSPAKGAPSDHRRPQVPAFPGAALLEAVFGDWLFPRWAAREPRRLRAAVLVDAYNHNNPLRYSGADYAEYPPWARLDEIERHLGELKLADVFGADTGFARLIESLTRPGARLEAVAERTRAEQERLDGGPVSAASSWID